MDKSETLRALYDDITALTAKGVAINRKREYVEKHGKLPESPGASLASNTQDLYAIKDKIKRLNDRICKTGKKLQLSAKAKNPDKLNEWQMKLDMDMVERDQLLQQKKEIENAIH